MTPPKEFPGAAYDAWKTTDPRDFEPEEQTPERDPDDAYDAWRDRQAEDLSELLDEIEDYFLARQDADHNGSRYIANEEMSLHIRLHTLRTITSGHSLVLRKNKEKL
jgi:hypothetical protein